MGFGTFLGYDLSHLVLQLKVGEEGALRRVPKLVNRGVFRVGRLFCSKGTAHTAVKQMDVAYFFDTAIGDELIVDL